MLFADELRLKQKEIDALLVKTGQVQLKYWPGQKRDGEKGTELKIEEKADKSLVTEADYKSNAILCDGLQELFPHSKIVSEEALVEVSQDEGFWLVDPLDGTSSFIDGNDDFAILLAYINPGGEVVAGWMSFPARGQTISAIEGEVSVSGEAVSGEPLELCLRSDSSLSEDSVYVRRKVEIADSERPSEVMPISFHTGQAFYLLFTGELSGVILDLDRFGTWDVAAPAAIARALGGEAKMSTGEPFRVSSVLMPDTRFIVGSTSVADELQSIHDQIW